MNGIRLRLAARPPHQSQVAPPRRPPPRGGAVQQPRASAATGPSAGRAAQQPASGRGTRQPDSVLGAQQPASGRGTRQPGSVLGARQPVPARDFGDAHPDTAVRGAEDGRAEGDFLARPTWVAHQVDAALDRLDLRAPGIDLVDLRPRRPTPLSRRLAAARRGAARGYDVVARVTRPLDSLLCGRNVPRGFEFDVADTGVLGTCVMISAAALASLLSLVAAVAAVAVAVVVAAALVVGRVDAAARERVGQRIVEDGASLGVLSGYLVASIVLRVGQLPTRLLRGLGMLVGGAFGALGLTGRAPEFLAAPLEFDREALPEGQRALADLASDVRDVYSCAVTLDWLGVPMLGDDGHTYDRTSVARWHATSGQRSSPITRQPLRLLAPDALAAACVPDAAALATQLESLAVLAPAAAAGEQGACALHAALVAARTLGAHATCAERGTPLDAAADATLANDGRVYSAAGLGERQARARGAGHAVPSAVGRTRLAARTTEQVGRVTTALRAAVAAHPHAGTADLAAAVAALAPWTAAPQTVAPRGTWPLWQRRAADACRHTLAPPCAGVRAWADAAWRAATVGGTHAQQLSAAIATGAAQRLSRPQPAVLAAVVVGLALTASVRSYFGTYSAGEQALAGALTLSAALLNDYRRDPSLAV